MIRGRMKRLLSVLLFVLAPLSALSRDFTFTFRLPAGRTECFYEYVHQGALLEVEYQVISGGELDVNFFVTGPNGESLVTEDRKLDSLHSIDVKQTGEYTICLDNSFSHVSEKMVFVDIIIEDDSGEVKENPSIQYNVDNAEVDLKLQNLSHVLTNMSIHLNKVVRDQQFFRARESRHRHTLEGNNRRVGLWSLTSCVVVVTVGILQVVLIRNLFKSRRTDKIRT